MPRSADGWYDRLVRAGGWAVLIWIVIGIMLAYPAANLEQILQVGATISGKRIGSGS